MKFYTTYDLREQYRIKKYIFETEDNDLLLSVVKDVYLKNIYPYDSPLFKLSTSGLVDTLREPRIIYRDSSSELEFSKYLTDDVLMKITISQDTMADQYVMIISSIKMEDPNMIGKNILIQMEFLDVKAKLFPNDYNQVIDYITKRMDFFGNETLHNINPRP